MSQSYKGSTDPQSTPGTSGLLTYSGFNGVDATHLKSTGTLDFDASGSMNLTGDQTFNGDVGIGSTYLAMSDTTSQGVHINNTGGASEIKLTNNGTAYASTNGSFIRVTTDSKLTITNQAGAKVVIGANNTDVITVSTDFNTGFSYANPTAKVSAYITGETANSQKGLIVTDAATVTAGVGVATPATTNTPYVFGNTVLAFGANGAEVGRFSTQGYLGVGTTAPTDLIDADGDSIRIRTPRTVATSTDDTGSQGSVAWDANYVYVKITSTGWARAALSSTF